LLLKGSLTGCGESKTKIREPPDFVSLQIEPFLTGGGKIWCLKKVRKPEGEKTNVATSYLTVTQNSGSTAEAGPPLHRMLGAGKKADLREKAQTFTNA